jgi:uncharacterized protein YciI
MSRSIAPKLALALLLAFAADAATGQPPTTAPTAQSARQLFLFVYRPGPSWRTGVPMREQDLRAHGAYHAQLVRDGRSVAGGGFVGLDGGMAIVRAADLAEAQAMLAADPAIVNGVFAADIRHWVPRFHSPAPLVEGAH